MFAIPGSIHSPLARGCHALIRQGAKLVETAADILEEISPTLRPVAAGASEGFNLFVADGDHATGDPLLAALAFDPVTLDALVARTGLATSEVSVRLLDLELEGRIARLPGQLFQRLDPR